MPRHEKPYSPACENNKGPILDVLRIAFARSRNVLEIGSGTGQHAVHFAAHLPHLEWQCADRQDCHTGINLWIDEARLVNLHRPFELDVDHFRWPASEYDAVFSANTAHIMSWQQVRCMIAGVGRVLDSPGVFCLYGPFNYQGTYTSDSNRAFDDWLRQQQPHQGIRDIEAVVDTAGRHDLELVRDHAMPANNRCLEFRKP